MKMINKNSKIYIAGHKGMVGSSVLRLLKNKSYKNILTRTRKQLNLINQKQTYKFLKKFKPDVVIIAAAKVGGIKANNQFRADFLYENLQIQNNLIHGSFLAGIKKLVFLGSSCIYPKNSPQPIKEDYLLLSPLEYTNEPYAIAKIAGLKLCENYNKQYDTKYISLMPCNLYGLNDNYDSENSHFLPALIKKIHEAKIKNKKNVLIWGDGKPKRELMYVDDLSNAILYFLNKNIKKSIINIGSNEEYTISKFAKLISKEIGYKGGFRFDSSKPNGTMRKILDSSYANKLGWFPKIKFDDGIKKIYKDYISRYSI